MHTLLPGGQGLCACGCGIELTGRQKRWASSECVNNAYEVFSVLKGNTGMIRKLLYQKQKGFCQSCGVYDPAWQADHIVPVKQGGGACGIEKSDTLP